MKIVKYLHTAILVKDLAKAEHFYGTVLGLEKCERSLNFAGVWYQLDNYQIHLIVSPTVENTPVNAEKWGRNAHIALAVDNLTKACDRLQTYGYPIQMSASGRQALFTQDPDGNIIEMSQI